MKYRLLGINCRLLGIDHSVLGIIYFNPLSASGPIYRPKACFKFTFSRKYASCNQYVVSLPTEENVEYLLRFGEMWLALKGLIWMKYRLMRMNYRPPRMNYMLFGDYLQAAGDKL